MRRGESSVCHSAGGAHAGLVPCLVLAPDLAVEPNRIALRYPVTHYTADSYSIARHGIIGEADIDLAGFEPALSKESGAHLRDVGMGH